MHKKILIIFFFFFFFLSLISAVPPVTQTQQFTTGYEILSQPIDYLPLNSNYTFNFFVKNISNGAEITNTTINCTFFMADNSGELLFYSDVTYNAEGYWDILITGGNFSTLGIYGQGIECLGGGLGGHKVTVWEVTPNGKGLTQSENNLFMGGLFLLIIFFIGSIICIYKFDHYIAKFVFYWVSHLLIILIFFSAWQFTNGYAIGYVGLAGIFKVFFYFFIIAVFPMLLVSIAWIVYIHTFNDHFQKLIDKGEDPETAFTMAKKKRRRW